MTNPERQRQKKVSDGKNTKNKNCVHHVHVSEYVLNSMFQVEKSVDENYRVAGGDFTLL